MTQTLALADPAVPQDPVGRANEAFAADPRPGKINLGIGVYTDASGRLPRMQAVRLAEEALLRRGAPHAYLPIEGLRAFNASVQALVLGDAAPAIGEGRAVTFQALGGTGALMLAARWLKIARPDAEAWVGDPTWDNHRAIFESSGWTVRTHPYHDDRRHALDFDAMLAALSGATRGAVVVLHACCHNPTGMDPSEAQWERVLDVVEARGLFPVCDLAYQGFGRGLRLDNALVRRLGARGLEFAVAQSLSKSLALYGERVGSLTVVLASARQAAIATTLLRRVVRSSYSNPPAYGAALAAEVLGTAELRALWVEELDAMRCRIDAMRRQFAGELARLAPAVDMSFIGRQRGMFSYSGLTPDEVARLRDDSAVHLLSTGRICVAALNGANLPIVVTAIGGVLRGRSSAQVGEPHGRAPSDGT